MRRSQRGHQDRRRRALALLTVLVVGFGWLVIGSPAAVADGPTTFSNTTAIAIPATGSADQKGPASPYPSDIAVSGLAGSVSKVTVTFDNLTHGAVADIDAMVVSPTGQNLVVLSDVGDPNQLVTAANVNLTFDDSAPGPVPAQLILPGGTYQPTDINVVGDSFPSPAPTPSNETTLSGAFTGINPNGTWHLYVVDDASGEVGTMAGGWSLSVTTEVAAASTTTSVVTSDATSTTGDPVTFTASVKAGATPVATGSVQFSDGGTSLGAPVALNGSGQAALTTSALAEGTHLIRATYTGATGFLASNGTVSQRVDNPTVVTANTFCNTGPMTIPLLGPAVPYPSHVTVSGVTGQVTKVTATLKGLSHQAPIDLDIMLAGPDPSSNLLLMSDAGGQSPVSNLDLTFDDAAAGPVPVPAVSGTFRPTDSNDGSSDTFPAPAPAPSGATALSTFAGAGGNGQWSLWVVDDASGDSGSIAGGWCLTVTSQVATTTTLTAAPNPSTSGGAVTLTATVASAGAAVTTGSVQFSDGATPLGGPVTVGSDGTAVLTTSALSVGSHPLVAAYGGTATLGESSGSVTQVVTKAATTTTLATDGSPSSVGDPVRFTATVTSAGVPVTTGSVQFTDGANPLGTAVPVGADGTATLTTSALDAGTHSIGAAYSGDDNLATSSDTLQQVVGKLVTSTSLTTAPNPSQVGAGVTLTANVTSGGAPVTTGTVQFADGATPLDIAVPVAPDGTATLNTGPLTAGSHALSATYPGTASYAGSTGTTTHVVDRMKTLTTLASTPEPSDADQSVTFTATVTSGVATIDAGDVTFTLDGAAQSVIPLAADGTATFATKALTPGTHTVTAAYSGSDTFGASTSTPLEHDVRPVADAGGPYTVAEGGSLTLNGSGPTPGVTYAWDLNGDGDFTDATGVSPTLTWAQLEALGITNGPSSHTATVQVTLGALVTKANATLKVTNTAPTAVVTGNLTATVGQPFTLKVGANDPSSADMKATFVYAVNWGDGSPVETLGGPADPPVTYTYATSGTFDAIFTATDKDGGTSEPTTVRVVAVSSGPTTTTSSTHTTSMTNPVSSPPSSPDGGGTLPVTGPNLTGPLGLGLAFLAAGGLLLVVDRRRRQTTLGQCQ
ncbi:MAG: Ig-like domain repeat protein [Terracoccus sp.]